MTELRRLEILGAYELLDTEDVSNERLLQMVADTCGCEIGEVLEALKEGKQMTDAELKARKLISERTTEQLVSDFELTDRINDVNISAVRGWIMDELEKRDSVAFDKWIDAYTDSPREFFLG